MANSRTLALIACASLLILLSPAFGNIIIASAGLIAAAASVSIRHRHRLLHITSALLWGAIVGLAGVLLTDRFDIRYVWVYSGAELPIHLKIANVWGGDEGTTLLLAAICAVVASSDAKKIQLRLDITALLTAVYAMTAAWLEPFAMTPSAWLQSAPSQGMNAHLMKVWMLAHAPLVLAAYACTFSLAGTGLAALRGEIRNWPDHSLFNARRAWALLTAGIGFGMVWAFEDAMYGQVWHWDPVQTAVFAVWCLLAAHLHGTGGWRIGRVMWHLTPLTAIFAGIMTAVAMAVTRSNELASSHRYIGASSGVVHLAVASALLIAGMVFLIRRCNCEPLRLQASIGVWILRSTQILFILIGTIAAIQLLMAFIASWQVAPRPEELKPFFSTLTNWARGSELPILRAAFAQWDVDGYAVVRWLLYPMLCIGLFGGWFFFRSVNETVGWTTLLIFIILSIIVVFSGGWLTHYYAGRGILSQQVVVLLPKIDGILVSGAYLSLGCVAWSARNILNGSPIARRRAAQLGMVHFGAVLALWGGVVSTALNSHSQQIVDLNGDWQKEYQGYAFRIKSFEINRSPDGGSYFGSNGFRALAEVEVETPDKKLIIGQTLYRDSRIALSDYSGPVRQICEILDYRYARYANKPGYLLDPLIEHSWIRDVQLWVSTSGVVAALDSESPKKQAVVILRIFPFVSLLWVGLIFTTIGATWLSLNVKSARKRDIL